MADHQKLQTSSATARSNKHNVNSSHLKSKKIISPEEVIQLFSVPSAHPAGAGGAASSSGHHHQQQQQHHHLHHPHLTGFLSHHHHSGAGGQQLGASSRHRTSSGSAIINESHRGRRSPSSASSPPTMTHQVCITKTHHDIVIYIHRKYSLSLYFLISLSRFHHRRFCI